METQAKATSIVKKLVREGHVAYFAGGWVRDYLMGHPSEDIDIATDAPPEKILDLFPHTVPVGLAFGVIIVLIDGHPFEVSTFRKDVEYVNGRKPERIELSTPYEDAIRRDFTINGMFYDPIEEVIYDYVQGKEDIKKGIIRTIGDPAERFFEDRLRMIRAIRFASRFGFSMDLETQQGIQDNALSLFPAVAMERVWQEFTKMAAYPRFDQAMVEMHRLGLLPTIFPSLQNVHLNDLKKCVEPFKHFPPSTPAIVYLMELFPEASLEELNEICLYLRTSANDAKLVDFIYKHKKLLLNETEWDKPEWTAFYAHPQSQLCLEVTAARFDADQRKRFLEEHIRRQKTLAKHIERILQKKPLVHGALLMKHGIPEGRRMGALLKEAERLVINHDLDDADEVIALLTNSSNWSGKF